MRKKLEPDTLLEAAKKFHDEELKSIAVLEHEVKHRKEELKGKLEKMLDVMPEETSYWGGYSEGIKRVFDAYQRLLDKEINDDSYQKFPESLYKDFELEVVLADSKELVKVLEKFTKKLGGK